MLQTPNEVVRALLTYTDWWQPATTSILHPTRRRGRESDGIPPGLVETLDERTELCLRMQRVDERDRTILFLWYLRQLPVIDIAKSVKLSRRQCFRRRAAAIRALADEDHIDAA